ncbi:VWFA domain-containing protein, partial [Meloidogyne graminicola]
INLINQKRIKYYGLIAFNHSSFILNSLESSNIEKVINSINLLKPRGEHLEISLNKALITATKLFNENLNNSKNIIILVHNGENIDLINENNETIIKLINKSISLFIIAGEIFNEKIILNYTNNDYNYILTGPKNENNFFLTIEKVKLIKLN